MINKAKQLSKSQINYIFNSSIQTILMQIHILLLLVLFLVSVHPLQGQQSLQVPQSFALITVTHTRGNQYKDIQEHINRYATMDCPIVSEMNIVWNNQVKPDQAPIFNNKTQWKRPVYFYKTPNNSMDWRYKIPSQIDDDVQIDCVQLQRGFKKWQQNAIGNIGPIVTYAVRYYQYTQQKGFSYGRTKQRGMFAIGLVGLSFMSRHFMDLYYANIQIIEEMRKIVRQKNNCDDIGINWIIQYFYPQLQTIYIQAVKGNLLANSPAVAQGKTSTHYPFRTDCILQFTKIFGVNVLRYKPIEDNYIKKQIRIIPLKKEIILAKKEYLENLIQGKNSSKNMIQGQNKNKKQNSTLAKQQQKKLPQKQQTSNPLKSSKQQKSVQYLSLEQVLLLSIGVLIILVVFLIILLFKMINQKKMILMRYNQIDAIQSSRAAINQE